MAISASASASVPPPPPPPPHNPIPAAATSVAGMPTPATVWPSLPLQEITHGQQSFSASCAPPPYPNYGPPPTFPHLNTARPTMSTYPNYGPSPSFPFQPHKTPVTSPYPNYGPPPSFPLRPHQTTSEPVMYPSNPPPALATFTSQEFAFLYSLTYKAVQDIESIALELYVLHSLILDRDGDPRRSYRVGGRRRRRRSGGPAQPN